MATWQFVEDMEDATPTVSLDLNASPLFIGDDYNFDPPKYNKGYASNPMTPGARLTNSQPGNRIVTLPIQFLATSTDSAASYAELIGREISKPNILKYQASSATAPVFFHTLPDPDMVNTLRKTLVKELKVTLQLEAKPFALGPRESLGTFTITNNPADANGCVWNVSGVSVDGDSPTPLLLVSTSTGASGAPSGLVSKWSHIATRRRGDPTFLDHVIQGEAMTQGTGAFVSADATMSDGSKSRIGFGTATEVLRLSDTFPESGVASTNARGEYIVYARVAKTVAGDAITCRIGYGASSGSPVFNDVVTLPSAAGPYWVNLGKLPVPPGSDPVTIGPSGIDASVLLPFFGFYAARSAGSGFLDVDCFFFMPADDQTLITRFPATDTTYAIDGTTEAGGSVYGVNTGLTQVITTASPAQIVGGGGFPELIPGQANRVYFLRQVNPDGTVDALSNSTNFAAYYWPRWREPFRP